ncbi:160_t:CDS:2, partial [Scutellospora calospora]
MSVVGGESSLTYYESLQTFMSTKSRIVVYNNKQRLKKDDDDSIKVISRIVDDNRSLEQ